MNGTEQFVDKKSFEDLIKSIESNDFDKFKECIDSGVNVYQIKRNETFHEGRLYKWIETPLLMSLKYGKEQIAHSIIDIYERDLEVLRDTSYKKAYVAMPDFQTEDFLKCCEFSIPQNEKIFEPVLLKKNKLELPKVAFLSTKNRKSLKFLYKLQRIGICDLNIRFPHPEIFLIENYLNESFKCDNFTIPKRLFASQFIDPNLKLSQMKTLRDEVTFRGKLDDYAEYFEDHEFMPYELQHCIYHGPSENFNFITRSMMKKLNCTFKELLRVKLDIYTDDIANFLIMHIIFINLSSNEVFWSLKIDDDDLTIEDGMGKNSLDYLLTDCKLNVQVLEEFIKRHPKLLEIQSKNNLSLLHHAVINGNMELIKMIYELCRSKEILHVDEEAAVECLILSNKFFKNDKEKVMEILKILINGNVEDFLKKHGIKILIKSLSLYHAGRQFVDFFLDLPFKIDLNQKFEGENIYTIGQECIFNRKTFEKIINYQEVIDWNVEGKSGQTLFMRVCDLLGKNTNLIKSIIEKHPECVTKISSNGSTCLHNFKFTTKETIEVLLKAGADPKIINNSGEKAIAKSVSNLAGFSALLPFESDDDLNIKYGENQNTLLHLVRDQKMVKMLLDRNADLSITNKAEQTPLHAHPPSDLKLIYLDHIISKKINFDINLVDNDGYSVLMRSIVHYEHKFFSKIIKNFNNKIDFDICNKNGDNFAVLVMQVHEDWFKHFFKIIKKEIFEIFVSKLPFERGHLTNNLLIVVQNLRLDSLKKNFEYFVNNERVLEVIFRKYPNFMELFDDKMSKFVKAVKKCEKPVAFDIILSKMSGSDLVNVNIDGENILHMICEKNNQEMINSVLDALTIEEVKTLCSQIYKEKTALEMLNEDNKWLFQEYLI